MSAADVSTPGAIALVTGGQGQVGFEVRRALQGWTVVAPSSSELDLRDPTMIRDVVRRVRPRVIVNAGAYTAVDAAESDERTATAVNATAPGVLAAEAAKIGARIIHYSTDYVFDGSSRDPYREIDTPNPQSVYGRTKLEGELAVAQSGAAFAVLRVCWVYGARGRNFFLRMLELGRERDELNVVDDQIGAPTWSRDIARATAVIASSPRERFQSGVYHLCSAGETSWFGFAARIFELAAPLGLSRQPALRPVASSAWPAPARRPASSRMSTEKIRETFGITLPDWADSLRAVVEEVAARGSFRPTPGV